jgi:hypothetical protein
MRSRAPYIRRGAPFLAARAEGSVDDRLIGKTLRREDSAVGLSKLVASPSFVEALASESTVVATVRVSRPYYIPPDLNLRTRISPTLFTASMTKRGLMATLDDAAVEAVQPSQTLHPDARP